MLYGKWFKSSKSNPNGECVETANFRKSSHSAAEGCVECGNFRKPSRSFSNGNCVECGDFRKSAHSTKDDCVECGDFRKPAHSGATNCVEVGSPLAGVAVRDTKQEHLGDSRTVLHFSPAAWQEFTAGLKAG